jgi:RNAse (barnase) inhibitor barstar
MRKIIFDFNKINNYALLNNFLAEELNLPSYMNGGYGYNFAAFQDVYSYFDDADFFELINVNSITDEKFKEVISMFIEILNDLKKTNPNFGYAIRS